MKSIVVVSSHTGNTLKLGGAVAFALNPDMDAVKVEDNPEIDDYDLVVVGCWIYRSNADPRAMEFIKKIKNKRVAFFATMGAYTDSPHASDCQKNIEALFDKSNELVGSFLSQGAVSLKTIKVLENKFPAGHPHAITPERTARLQEGFTHPNRQDMENAYNYFLRLRQELEAKEE